ncbi:hypothetical protein GGQ73_004273 [Rhizobium skierniewicense]|uniref:DUF2946 domain-containing protein n=1 Tax=Rhizobium skierniewicense TaxID=984260 RepID=A0A7W6C9R4_9HYPH|nr:DUF2946 family protein [Rhizobium skierniewicense]MBB3948297.1 hypothetical protein [Rhizobium skierniewicense]NTF31469.1 DUF2946 domain-containing protein [Rhizobium skierniewicense]
MKFVRKIMQDRSSAGAVAMLALLLFLLQGLATGVANGSMAATALSADDVICSSHTPASAIDKKDTGTKAADNCCGALCRLASASAVALLVTSTELTVGTVPKTDVASLHHDAGLLPAPPNRESQPRAPPFNPQS